MPCHEKKSHDNHVVDHRHHQVDRWVLVLFVEIDSMLCVLQLKVNALLEVNEREQRLPNTARADSTS